MSNSSHPYGLQHTSHPCPSLFPRICSDSCLLSQWCYLTISSPVTPFSFGLQSFPGSRSFLMSLFSVAGGQSTEASTSASVLPVNMRGWFSLGLTGLISLQSKGLSSLLQHHNLKSSVLQCLAFFMVQLSHPFKTTGKTIALTRLTFAGKVMSLLFNLLSRLVIAFLLRTKCLLIS